MTADGGDLTDPLAHATDRMRMLLGGFALVGTVVPFLFFVFNVFGLGIVGRLVSTFALFVLIVGAGVASTVNRLTDERDQLRDALERVRTDARELALSCLTFEILNGDSEMAMDEDHFYTRQERVYDISGDRAYFYNRYVGEVKPGRTSRGIVFKYIGDGRVDGTDLPISVTRNEPEPGDDEDVTPEIITNAEDPYAVTLRLPFGEELSGGDRFDLEVECPEMGATPSNQRVMRVHFPLHRYERVDVFDAEIVTPRRFDECEAAVVELHRDEITKQRDVLVEDFELTDLDVGATEAGDTTRYSFVRERSAAKLYVFRFLTGE